MLITSLSYLFIFSCKKMSIAAESDPSGFGSLRPSRDRFDTYPYQWNVIPKPNVGIRKTTERQITAQNLSDQDGPYTFVFPNIPSQVIDGGSAMLNLTCQVCTGPTNAGTKVNMFTELGVTPDVANTMFESIQIDINSESYSELGQDHYAYKAYVEKLLRYSPEANSYHLAPAVFLPDNKSFFSSWTVYNSTETLSKVPAEKVKENFWKRTAFVLNNNDAKFSLVSELHLDIFQASRFMPPGLQFTLHFLRAPKAFYMKSKLANPDFWIKIIDFKIDVNYITLETPLYNSMASARTQVVPYNKVVIFKSQFPVGLTHLTFDITKSGIGILPRQLLIGMIETKAFQGDYQLSPFMFSHFKIAEIGLVKNGERHPIDPLTMDFRANKIQYSKVYQHFMRNLGLDKKQNGCHVTMETYPFGHTLFPFDLSNDRSNNFNLFPYQTGTLSVEIKLYETYEKPITLLIFACYSKALVINNGQVEINDM